VVSANMPAKREKIEIMPILRIGMQRKRRLIRQTRHHMGGPGRNNEPPKPADDKPKKPKRVPVEDDDYEDGDIATPKRDRTDNDDEPV
jgi:hypothetical protein